MVNIPKKLWVHCGRVKSNLDTYIALFILGPVLTMGFSYLIHAKEINGGVQGAVKTALLIGLKWYAIIMPIVTVLFVIWFLFYSDTIEFTDDCIKYYRWIFSKKARNIFYDNITECVISDGLWEHQGKYLPGRVIRIYNKNKIVLLLGLYYKICLAIIFKLSDKKVRLVGENDKLITVDKYFKIDFMSLTYEQQVKLMKRYCRLAGAKYKDAKQILKLD